MSLSLTLTKACIWKYFCWPTAFVMEWTIIWFLKQTDVKYKDKFKLFFPGTSLGVYVASVTLPSIRAQPATGRWEFPPANWWQWSIRQHTHEAPDCAKPQRPPTKQLEKDLFKIGSCIVFSCTHLIKHIAWWPQWSYFICQTNMERVLNFVLSIYFSQGI